MKKLSKLALSLFLLAFSAVFIFSHGDTLPYSPWAYRFFVDTEQVAGSAGTTAEVVANYEAAQPIWIDYVRTLQHITGQSVTWIKLPSAGLIGVLVYAVLKPLQTRFRLLATFTSIAGPITTISYTFALRKYLINIGLVLSFLLIILAVDRQQENRYISVMMLFGSVILWFNHYTFWPFFAIFAITYQLFKSFDKQKYASAAIATLLILLPFVLYERPSLAYVSVVPALIVFLGAFDITSPIASINQLSKGQSAAPEKFDTFVASASGGDAPISLLALHLGYVLPIMGLVGLWVIANYDSVPRRVRQGFIALRPQTQTRTISYALAVAFGVTSVMYLVIGYKFRIMTFWPIVMPVFIRDLWISWDGGPKLGQLISWESAKKVAVISLFGIALIHMGTIAPYDYINSEQPSKASVQQVEGSEFASYIVNGPIYTDLLHKSILVTERIHDSAIVGHGSQTPSGEVALNQKAALLFEPNALDEGYVLQTNSNTDGLIIRGATVALPENTGHEHRCANIYENGMDSWYTKCS